MRMADARTPDLVIGDVKLLAAEPPEDGLRLRPPSDDVEPLCRDVPIGRMVSLPRSSAIHRYVSATYLSLDIDLTWRCARRVLSELDFRMSGGFLVLAIQVRQRALKRDREPFRFERDFGRFGDPCGPWPLARFQPKSGVDLADLLRLATLAQQYDRNDDADGVRFIPQAHEQELRWIAHRLASNTPQGRYDFCE